MRWFLILFLCVMALAGAPQVHAQDDDRGYLAQLLEDQLGGPGRTVRIEGFQGAFSSRATIAKITIADSKGVWLSVENAAINWTRSGLLKGAVDVQEMSADRLVFSRAPLAQGTGLPAAEAQGFSLPELPVSIALDALSIKELILGEQVLGEAAKLSFEGQASLADGNGSTQFKLVRTDNKAGQFTGTAQYTKATERIDLDISLIEGQGGILARLAGLPREPQLQATIKGSGPLSEFTADLKLATEGMDRLSGQFSLRQDPSDMSRRFKADVSGDVAALFLPQYRDFFGNEIALKADGNRATDGAISLEDFSLSTDALALKGAIDLTPAFWPSRIAVEGQIKAPDGDPLLLPLAGAETRIGQADLLVLYDADSGDAWRAQARVFDILRTDERVEALALVGQGTLDPAQSTASIGAVSGDFQFVAEGVALADGDLQSAIGERLVGELNAQFSKGAPLEISQIELSGDTYQLTGSAQVGGVDAAFETRFDLDLAAQNLAQFSGVIGRRVGGRVDVSLKGRADAGGAFDVDVAGQASGLQVAQPQADRVLSGRTTLSGNLARTAQGLTVSGLNVENPQIVLRADAQLSSQSSSASFSTRLAQSSLVLPGASGPLAVSGDATAIGEVWSVDVQGTGPFGVTGAVQGTVTGPRPELAVQARMPNIGVLVDGFSGPASVNGTLAQQGANWVVDAALTGPASANARVDGNITTQGIAALRVTGGVPLGLLNPLVSPRRIQGLAALDLAVNGPLEVSSIAGRVGLSDVRISAPSLNIALENGSGGVALSGGRAEVQFNAAASTGGRISVAGGVGLARPMPTDLAVQLDNLGVRDPALYRSLVSGPLTLTGDLVNELLISGELVLRETRIKVPSTGLEGFSIVPEIAHVGASSPVLETQRKAGLGVFSTGAETSQSTGGAQIRLDVGVSAPNRIFVRGRGLDAELGGALRVTGTSDALVSAGRFELIRGRLDLLTKRFDLDEGSIQLSGDLDPFIRFVATTQTETGTASVIVSGRASAPEVTFSSNPASAPDEVLAQIFFGRSATQLSAFQALELANAVRRLQGKGGEGVVAKLRRSFDLDDLDIRVDEDGTAAVRAGKYISENVYTDIEVGQTTEVTINVDITSNLTARGTLGSDGNTSLGVFFEKDY